MKLVISVAGGGALGIGPLQFMKRLEADLGANLGDIAEVFAGTSTGSIIASGLCDGMTAEEIYNLYSENLSDIFKKRGKSLSDLAGSGNYCRYENSFLKSLLYKMFPGKMNAFKKPIYIPTTYMNGESVEKVWDRTDDWMDRGFAILSSCSAPTYFDIVTCDGKTFCDGGMWANDPIMVLESAVKKLSAQKKYKALAEGVKILSFDTGMTTPNKPPKQKNALGWLNYVMGDWVARSGNANYFEACANIGAENIFRASPKVAQKYEMDKVSKIKEVSKIWDEYYTTVKKDVLKFVKSTM